MHNTENTTPAIPSLEFNTTDGNLFADRLTALGAHLPVAIANWPDEYPYTPKVDAYLAHNRRSLLVYFTVEEANVRAVAMEDHGRVWEDSCVEVFIGCADGERYINFETNCVGTHLASRRTGRTDAVPFTPEEMAAVVRRPSLPHAPIDLTAPSADEPLKWTMQLEIPFTLLGYPEGTTPSSLNLNLYKCGDLTATPHFLSWAPISVPTPNFHLPAFFRTLPLQ